MKPILFNTQNKLQHSTGGFGDLAEESIGAASGIRTHINLVIPSTYIYIYTYVPTYT